MGFFDHVPRPTEPLPAEPEQPDWDRPEAVLPGIIPQSHVLARTDDVALAIDGLRAYPNGFMFGLVVVFRRSPRGRHSDVMASLHHLSPDEPLGDEVLRLGVRFPDGRTATNLDRPFAHLGAGRPMLVARGGGGGGRRWDQDFWVHPLPPPGALAFVCEWPVHGIEETMLTVDAADIRVAASRAVPLF